jgi:hypothetical protein
MSGMVAQERFAEMVAWLYPFSPHPFPHSEGKIELCLSETDGFFNPVQ